MLRDSSIKSMRFSTDGLTRVGLMIVIAAISMLAALTPPLLQLRSRALDAGTVFCLRQLSRLQEAKASEFPFVYDVSLSPTDVAACQAVTFFRNDVHTTYFGYEASYGGWARRFRVEPGTAVVPVP
jgi:hypothetical protein